MNAMLPASWPLLPVQHELWMLDRLRGSGAPSLRAELQAIDGPLDIGRFRQAVARAVAEAESLHRRVALQGRAPVLVPATPSSDCPLIDLSGEPNPEEAALAWFASQCRHPIDPEGASPFGCTLLRLAPERHLWARFLTQVACDAPGAAALARRLYAHLRALEAGAPAPPAPAALADAVRAFALPEPAQQAARRHWQARLATLPPLLFPGASVAATATTPQHRFAAAGPRARAAQAGTTLPRLALAATAHALGRHFGRDAVALSVQVDLRPGARFRDTVGSFATGLPLVADELHAPVAELALRLGTRLAADFRHGRLPLRGIAPRPGGGPLADAQFNYLPAVETGWPVVARHHGPSAPLMVVLREEGDDLSLTLDHDPALLPPAEAVQLQSAIVDALTRQAAQRALPPPVPADLAALAALLCLPVPALAAALAALAAARVQDRLGEAVSVAAEQGGATHGLALPLPATTRLGAWLHQAAAALRPGVPADPPAVTVHLDGTAPRLAFAPNLPPPVREGIAAAWACLLADAPATLATPASALRILPPEEATALLALGRGPTQALPEPATLPALIAAQAARTPDAIAVQDGQEALDYRSLLARAEAIAGRLAATGAGRGAVIGLRLARNATLVAALLAVHRLGAAFLPLDPTHPAARQRQALQDAGAMLLLADAPCGLGIAELRLDLAGPSVPVDALPAAMPDDTAYVLFTSGSTGRPKGVAVSQRSIANLALHAAATLGEEACHGMFFSTALTFDVAMFELFAPLVTGGRLLVAAHLPALTHSPLRAEVRTVSGSPTILEAVLRAGGLPAATTTVVTIGEALTRALADRLLAARPGLRLINAYGPTEATVYVSEAAIGPGRDAPCIGRPIANVSMHVLDRHGALLPRGVEGELCLGGVAVAQGYVGRPDLTEERFVPDPFTGDRLYRTGDRASWRPDGQLDFLGRTDGQFKLNGVRMEVAEIEAALRAVDGIAAAAIGLRGEGSARRLVAWLVPSREPPPLPALRRRLATLLPKAMIPAAFAFLPALPTTASGKLDTAALPTPQTAPDDAEPAGRPPSSDGEHAMLRLWQDVLDLPAIQQGDIGAEDTLADLGVDSFGVVLVCAEVEAVHGRPVPPELIEAGLSLASLATFVEGQPAPPSLHLRVDGRLVLPTRRPGGAYAFPIPLPAAEIAIVSPVGIPNLIHGGHDSRRLGVLLQSIAWEQGDLRHEVQLDAPLLGEGFHGWEHGSRRRWTNGHAVLADHVVPPWHGPATLLLVGWDWQAGQQMPTPHPGSGLLAGFESLGASCEFGFVQRETGTHVPPSLLRWAGTDLRRLLLGLADDFIALEDPVVIDVVASKPDYVLTTPYAALHTHESLTALGEDALAVMKQRGMAALGYLRRKLLADLREGRKIFVFAAPDLTEPDTHTLKAALARHGPGRLLCVTTGTPSPARRLAPGLYTATITRLVGSSGPFDDWLRICQDTLALRAEEEAV